MEAAEEVSKRFSGNLWLQYDLILRLYLLALSLCYSGQSKTVRSLLSFVTRTASPTLILAPRSRARNVRNSTTKTFVKTASRKITCLRPPRIHTVPAKARECQLTRGTGQIDLRGTTRLDRLTKTGSYGAPMSTRLVFDKTL